MSNISLLHHKSHSKQLTANPTKLQSGKLMVWVPSDWLINLGHKLPMQYHIAHQSYHAGDQICFKYFIDLFLVYKYDYSCNNKLGGNLVVYPAEDDR